MMEEEQVFFLSPLLLSPTNSGNQTLSPEDLLNQFPLSTPFLFLSLFSFLFSFLCSPLFLLFHCFLLRKVPAGICWIFQTPFPPSSPFPLSPLSFPFPFLTPPPPPLPLPSFPLSLSLSPFLSPSSICNVYPRLMSYSQGHPPP